MRRILTIKLGALGDVIMATPLLSAIALEHTEDQRYVLTTAPFVRLFERFDGFEIHAVTRQGALNLLRTVRWRVTA